MSKQHIWPKWLSKIRKPLAASHTQVTGEFLSRPGLGNRPIVRNIHQGHAGSRKIKTVCQICNNGWMSQIEEAAKDAAVPLILDRESKLTSDQQRELARWFTLMTMMVEFTDPATAALTGKDRTFFKINRDPPPNFKMWIGRYIGKHPEQHWCRHIGMNMSLTPEPSDDPYKCNTQVTTIVLGALCIHTYSSTVDPDFPGYVGAPIEQIWPLREQIIQWPLLVGLNDNNIIALAESLGAHTKPVPGWG